MEKSSSSHHVDCNDALLAKFKLFADLNPEEMSAMLSLSSTEAYAAGERIISNGDSGHCMYLVIRGSVQVTIQTPEKQIELASLKAGDFFGEVSLVDDGPRSADVTAVEDCVLLCITRTTLGVLAGLQPGAAIQLLASIGRNLVARLRAGNQKYMDLIVLNGQLS